MMPIRAYWNSLIAFCKKWRPAKRRRQRFGSWAESFEPRRLLSAFVVNSLGDSHDANPGDGIAADTHGVTTLRAAIEEANARAGADTIYLPAGVISAGPESGGGFVITDELSIVGAGRGSSVIDGSALDQVFQIADSGRLHLSGVNVISARDVAAAGVRSNLLTTNVRQADLIVAFSATPKLPVAVETKTPNGLSPLMGIVTPESQFDEAPCAPAIKTAQAYKTFDKWVKPDDAIIPTPDATIEEIVNALFHSESTDLILPAGVEKKSMPMAEERLTSPMPMSETDHAPKPSTEDAPPKSNSDPSLDGMMSDFDTVDDEQSFATPVDHEEVGAVLRGWAEEAGWQSPDFWTSGFQTQVVSRPAVGRQIAAMAAIVLSGVSAESWSSGSRWLRDSVNVVSWRRRFERLRRRAR
ncbi:MAG TPA: hypothetical protein VK137_20115 [Planctomycetaceae bacterium]|nr:hypothetical protein [Planctomycetaceae bacterium]